MYGLSTSVSRSLPDPEFDSISSILAHSSLKQTAPWKSSVDDEGSVFYVELDECPCQGREVPWCFAHNKHGLSKGSQLSKTLPRQHRTNGRTLLSVIHDQWQEKGLANGSPKECVETLKQKVLNGESNPVDLLNINKSCDNTHIQHQNGRRNAKPGCHTWSPKKRGMNGSHIEVYISLNPNYAKNGHKRPASLCERLLGVVPGELSCHCPTQVGEKRSFSSDKVTSSGTAVVVRGIVPDSSALRCRRIKPGQVLLTVNDCRVDAGNLDSVLTELLTTRQSNKIKLTLTTPRQHEACIPVLRRRDAVSGHVLSQLPHDYWPAHQPLGGAIMYFSLESESPEDGNIKEDIVYKFPKSSNEVEAIRGAFITLVHTLVDVADSPTKSSSVLVGSRLTQVCYHLEGRNLLVMSAPAFRESSGSQRCLEFILRDVVRLLRLQYASIDQAFSTQHHMALDHLFTLLFRRHLTHNQHTTVTSPFLSSLACVQGLNLSNNTKARVDTELSNFEAADFAEKSEDSCGLRRTFAILGTCIFYKGYLLGSHLPAADLTDVYLYLSYHGLLPPTPRGPGRPPPPPKQLVLWQEVFPTRRCQDVPYRHVFGYSEPDSRWFLLAIGMNHSVFCVLLESGGCTSRLTSSPGPDCVYLEQAKACLLQVMSTHLIQACDKSIESGELGTVNADCYLPDKQNNLGERNSWGGSYPSRHNHSVDSALRLRTNSLDKPSGPTSTHSPFRRTSSLGSRLQFPAEVEVHATAADDLNHVESPYKRCGGSSLFQYVYVETVEGVFITPCTSLQGPIQTELMKNFQQACLSIRSLFAQSKRVQKVLDEGKPRRFGVDVTFDMVEEHGILFQFDQSQSSKKSLSPLTYWVVGRLFRRPSRRELYVCFHESTRQNLVELAFRLSWGRTVA